MTTATAPAPVTGYPGMRVTQGRVIRSEWTKFRSLRSSKITLLVAVVLTIGLGALISAVTAAHYTDMRDARRAAFDPIVTSLNGVNIAQLAVGVLGVLLISGEYATGMIRSSLTAVPERLPVLWAKITVFTVIVGIASIASTVIAFFLGQSLLSGKTPSAGISDPGALRMVIGAGVYLLLVGLVGRVGRLAAQHRGRYLQLGRAVLRDPADHGIAPAELVGHHRPLPALERRRSILGSAGHRAPVSVGRLRRTVRMDDSGGRAGSRPAQAQRRLRAEAVTQ